MVYTLAPPRAVLCYEILLFTPEGKDNNLEVVGEACKRLAASEPLVISTKSWALK